MARSPEERRPRVPPGLLAGDVRLAAGDVGLAPSCPSIVLLTFWVTPYILRRHGEHGEAVRVAVLDGEVVVDVPVLGARPALPPAEAHAGLRRRPS